VKMVGVMFGIIEVRPGSLIAECLMAIRTTMRMVPRIKIGTPGGRVGGVTAGVVGEISRGEHEEERKETKETQRILNSVQAIVPRLRDRVLH
jgi:hypothetical protein